MYFKKAYKYRKAIDWERIFAIHVSEKLVYRIYEEHVQMNQKKSNNQRKSSRKLKTDNSNERNIKNKINIWKDTQSHYQGNTTWLMKSAYYERMYVCNFPCRSFVIIICPIYFCLFFIILITALLRYYSHAIKYTVLKCTMQWVLVYLQSCASIVTI